MLAMMFNCADSTDFYLPLLVAKVRVVLYTANACHFANSCIDIVFTDKWILQTDETSQLQEYSNTIDVNTIEVSTIEVNTIDVYYIDVNTIDVNTDDKKDALSLLVIKFESSLSGNNISITTMRQCSHNFDTATCQ